MKLGMLTVQVGNLKARVPSELVELARVRTPHWLAVERSLGDEEYELVRVPTLQGRSTIEFDKANARRGAVALKGRRLFAMLPDDPFAAEAAMKALFAVLVSAQEGLLVHASGISIARGAVVASGPSGAGKSTLARLCIEGSGAALLSDETIALMPDGKALGTPFRSDAPAAPFVDSADVWAVVALAKGRGELLEHLSKHELTALLLSQTYRIGGGQTDYMRRAAALAERLRGYRLTFRKSTDVAHFLEQYRDERDV